MSAPIFTSIYADLVYDITLLATVLIPLGIAGGFLFAGAWILDLKGNSRWPAVFAVTPFFWLFEGWMDKKPGQPERTIHTVAAVAGPLNVAAIYLALRLV